MINQENVRETKRVIYGSYIVFQKLWQDLKIDKILLSLKDTCRASINIENNVFLMALQHLVKPQSKLSTYSNRERLYGDYSLSLHHLFGFDVFSGNTFDGKTLPSILSSLKKKFNLERVVLVSDKAILSKENIRNIQDCGFEFIISCSLRTLPEDIKAFTTFIKEKR